MAWGDMMLDHLRALREDRDLSQEAMAEFLNVHQTTYSDYELGYSNMSAETLAKLAEFFDTSVDYLLGLTDEPRPYPRKKRK